MKALIATYDFSTVITAETDGIVIGTNSVTFDNTGDVDAILNDNYPLPAGESLTLKNDYKTVIGGTFKVAFATGSGIERVNIIKESLS